MNLQLDIGADMNRTHLYTTGLRLFFCIRPPLGLLPVLGPQEAVHDSYTFRSPAY